VIQEISKYPDQVADAKASDPLLGSIEIAMSEDLDWGGRSYYDGIVVECLVGGNHKIVIMAKEYAHWDCRY